MSTQYDNIAGAYDAMTKMLPEQIEHFTLDNILRPLVKNANVLELACGLGFHSRGVVDMGAFYVLAIDISQKMIEAAKAAATTTDHKDRIEYKIANCQKPEAYDDDDFDVVIACWLLNYAPDYRTLLSTFRNAFLNLKSGGIFTGSTVVPSEDPVAWLERQHLLRPKRRGIPWIDCLEIIEGGMKVRTTALLEENEDDNVVKFENYHLKESLYQHAATAAGFKGGLEWQPLQFPALYRGAPEEAWLRDFVTLPETGIFIARKS